MSKSIKISPKHGLNPSMGMCFWCHQPTGEILIPGKIDKEDSEAPKYMVTSYEPCDACREKMEQGVTFMGVVDKQPEDKRPAIATNQTNPETGELCDLYPTGSIVTLREEAVDKIISDPNIAANIKRAKKTFCSEQVVQDMLSKCNPNND